MTAPKAVRSHAAYLVPGRALQREPIGTVQASGETYLNGQRVTVEVTIFSGDTLVTRQDGRAMVALPRQGMLVVGPDSEVTFDGGRRYFASLIRGAVAFRALADSRNAQILVGRFLVVPVQDQEAAVEIERAPEGSARIRCVAGSIGVFALEGPEQLFVSAGREATISAEGILRPVEPPPAAPTTPAPPPQAKKRGARTALIILGVAGGAGGAALALSRKRESVSPSTP